MFLVNNRDLMRNYGFDDKIINHSFTDLIIKSDNLELFKLYATYNKNKIIDILAKCGAIKILKYTHENGCYWMNLRVMMQLKMDIWIVCVMHMRMVVLGMNLRVEMQL